MGRTRKPPQPSDNASIARALRSDSDLMRYSEWWVRRRIYGHEDETVRWLIEQYIATYREIISTLPDAYDNEGRPILGQRARLLAQIEREIDALAGTLIEGLDPAILDGFRQGYYGRAWLLDTVTVQEWNATKNVLLPSEQIRALVYSDYVGTDEWIDLRRVELTNRIKRSLTASMIAGEGMQKAARRLRNELGVAPGQTRDFKGAAYKTLLIARTEIMRASNLGALAVYEQNQDVLKGWEWVATLDERTCPICGRLDGKVFPFGSRQEQPPSGSHPGCRCTVTPVLIDDELMERIAGVRENYCDWAARNGIVDDAGLCRQRSADAHGLNATSARK